MAVVAACDRTHRGLRLSSSPSDPLDAVASAATLTAVTAATRREHHGCPPQPPRKSPSAATAGVLLGYRR